jgi:hypothetical protein
LRQTFSGEHFSLFIHEAVKTTLSYFPKHLGKAKSLGIA